MSKISGVRNPLKTIFLGGFFALLPLALLLTVFSWLYGWLTDFVSMNGFAIQTQKENLKFLNVEPEQMMKSVLSCGLGSAKYTQ